MVPRSKIHAHGEVNLTLVSPLLILPWNLFLFCFFPAPQRTRERAQVFPAGTQSTLPERGAAGCDGWGVTRRLSFENFELSVFPDKENRSHGVGRFGGGLFPYLTDPLDTLFVFGTTYEKQIAGWNRYYGPS